VPSLPELRTYKVTEVEKPRERRDSNNFWVQMAALVILTVVLIALAAKYIW
jgi:hypothetical protein